MASQVGFNRRIDDPDIRADLPSIQCPTLVITTAERGPGTVERARGWQERMPRSRLRVLPGKSHHAAAGDAQACAGMALGFIWGS